MKVRNFQDHQQINLNSTSLKTSYKWKYVHSEAICWFIKSAILWNANVTHLVSQNRLIIYVYKILFLACWECGRMPFKYESKSTPFRKTLKAVGEFRQCIWQSTNIVVFWDVITCRLSEIYCRFLGVCGARGGAVGWGTALQDGRSRVRFPMVSWEFFIDNPSGRTMALGLT